MNQAISGRRTEFAEFRCFRLPGVGPVPNESVFVLENPEDPDSGHARVRAASASGHGWDPDPSVLYAARTNEPEKQQEAESNRAAAAGIPGPLVYPQSNEGTNNTVGDEGR